LQSFILHPSAVAGAMTFLLCFSFALAQVAAGSAGSPVFITDLLPRAEDVQAATKVDLSGLGWNGTNEMYSGFITINKELGKNTFFWYSSSLDGNKDAPLLVWLQGGPGASSLFGMFTEIGPFNINTDGKIEARQVNWNQHHHLLFLDNPVGTGFSFTESVAGFATDQKTVGSDLHAALLQFFEAFPMLRKNDLYITGESYAGKYVPACGYTIHIKNKQALAHNYMNLKGISIGDGAMDPAKQFDGFSDLLWNLGMVDETERKQFKTYEATIQQKLKAGDNVGAFHVFDEMLNGDFYPYGTYYANVTGMTSNYFNFELAPDATPLGGDFVEWLKKPEVRAQIHVGDRSYAPANSTVEVHLVEDWMRGVVDMLVPLLENYKVLIYSGQNDVILGPPLTEQFLWDLDWSGRAAYQQAKKAVWRLKTKGQGSQLPDVAGYTRRVGNFVQAVVRGAGHMVPGDQPERALDLISQFVAQPRTDVLASASSTVVV
jgi:vitellogenic carboxypeptidase-like protein